MPLTSPQSQDVLDTKLLGLQEVSCHLLLGDIGTCDVQHRIQTAVVQGSTGYGHRACFLITWRGGGGGGGGREGGVRREGGGREDRSEERGRRE